MSRRGNKVLFTKTALDGFTCPPGQKDAWVFDSELPGFGVRITTAGSKVFYLQYSVAGRVQRHRLGAYGVLTLDQARRLARIAAGEVAGGNDPRADRLAKRRAAVVAEAEAKREAAAEAYTLRAMAAEWHAVYLSQQSRPRYADEALRTIHLGFGEWLDRPATALATDDAVRALDAIGLARGPWAARRSFKVLHTAYGWAVSRLKLGANPLAGLKAPPKMRARQRALTDAELGTVWRAAEKLGQPFGPFVQVLILTLQRRQEVAAMRWSELAPDMSEWILPAERAKNGKTHVVQLAAPVRAILAELPRFEGSDLVFTTTGETPISGFARSKARLDKLALAERRTAKVNPPDMPPWVLHDFRRTGVSTMAARGVLPDVADRILNHQASSTNEGVKAVYQVHSFKREREAALQLWARHVLAVAERGRPDAKATRATDNIVQLASRKRGQAS